ncbi:MAG TPA: type II secretion system F family protein [Baekduia sp.]|uniref:type II secretion system F family protein n=1 Tax=Baekduia sp. TaxID=2600305 RepID=UPI002B9A5A81|nr:type II secretion system F family protein [Baekduia sp.]HMJ34045.1 type II secretion system F family protein [Baekduia sp.]
MIAPLLAALAAAFAVFGAWDGLAVLEQARPVQALGRVVAPLRLAGRAGREPTAPERRRLAVLGAGALLSAGWLLAGPVAGAVLAGAGPAAVGPAVAARRRRWRRGLADGVPAVARALADALAGGHSIRGALQDLGASGAVRGAAGGELAVVARRLTLGEPTDAVLERLRRRADDPAWDTLVAAILLQREAGGDLARLLRSVAEAREHARRVEADARGLTAQARATARLVAGLPFAGLAFGELVAPGSLATLLADPRSRLLLVAALAVGALALTVITRLARLGAA